MAYALVNDGGVVLNANREVRVKLYIGQVCIFPASGAYRWTDEFALLEQVFMGWFWFVPTFHMTHPRRSVCEPTLFRLGRKEIDFPLGVGSHLVDVTVAMEWCPPDAEDTRPPSRQSSRDSAEGKGEPTGLAAALEAAAIGQTQEAVDATAVGKE